MQNLFKKTILFFAKAIAVIAFALVMFMPASTFAATNIGITSTSTRPDASVRGICLRLVSLEGAISTKLAQAQSAYLASVSQRMLKIKSLSESRNSEDATTRKAVDLRMSAYSGSLTAQALDDTERKAITIFFSTVLKATTEKRASVDASLRTFTDGVKTLASARDLSVKTLTTTLSNDIKAAIASAQASCGSDTDPKDVRDDLHKSLDSITAKYKASLEDRTSLYEGLQALTDVRRQAVKEATDTYTQKLNIASQNLHAVVR